MAMKYPAAYLLAVLGGEEHPTAASVRKILDSVGADIDDAVLGHLISEMNGKNIHEIISCGMSKLSSMPSGGAVSAAPAAVAAGGAAPAPVAEAAKSEEEVSGDDDMGFSLFD